MKLLKKSIVLFPPIGSSSVDRLKFVGHVSAFMASALLHSSDLNIVNAFGSSVFSAAIANFWYVGLIATFPGRGVSWGRFKAPKFVVLAVPRLRSLPTCHLRVPVSNASQRIFRNISKLNRNKLQRADCSYKQFETLGPDDPEFIS